MKKLFAASLMLFLFAGASAQQYVWTQKANFGGGDRYGAFFFSIGTKGYAGSGVTFTGSTIDYIHMDFWEYDQPTDVWTQKADIPDTCKKEAIGFSVGSKGYFTTGWDPSQSDSTFEYDPGSNTWSSKAAFGGGARYTCTRFVIDSFAYVGMGYSPLHKDFWRYDANGDSWTQVADIGGQPRQAATGFAIDGMGYVFGGGEQFQFYSNDLWKYDPDSNDWNQMTSLPAPGRNSIPSFVIDGKGFVGCGADANEAFKDFWSYDPMTDTWTQVPDFPGGTRLAAISFEIGNRGYVGTGSSDNYPNIIIQSDLWELIYTDANNISGTLYADFNSNGTQDSGEVPIPNHLITENNSGRFAFSQSDGSYNVAVLTSGSFTVETDSFGLFSPTPASQPATFVGLNEVDSLNDFAFQASTVLNDLCIQISPMGAFRPGFDALYKITYENNGTTTIPGTVVFYPDTSVTFISADVAPDSVTADSVLWDVGMLNPFQTGSILVTVNITSTTPIGTQINSSAKIEPIAGDDNPSCNTNAWEVVTTGSFDPNDILVNTAEFFDWQLPNLPALEYMIRFQNTGNDTAFTVDIHNVVPAGVDLATFEFIASSHPVSLRYVEEYDMLGFKFENILLADSNVNEPESHGFVRYRITPVNTLMVGDSIANEAGIYFDFNAVVPTNTVVTKVISTVSIHQKQDLATITIGPNPVLDELTIYGKEQGDYKISVYATSGKLVLRKQVTGKRIVLPFGDHAGGVYILQVELNGIISRAKFLKE